LKVSTVDLATVAIVMGQVGRVRSLTSLLTSKTTTELGLGGQREGRVLYVRPRCSSSFSRFSQSLSCRSRSIVLSTCAV